MATFAGCKIDLAGTLHVDRDRRGVDLRGQHAASTITVGAAAKVAFTTQPSGATGGVAFATQPVVKVQDAGGNTVTTNTSSVTLDADDSGRRDVHLHRPNPQAAVAGVATFAGCKIDLAGTYTLTATDGLDAGGEQLVDDHRRRGGEARLHDAAERFDRRCRVRAPSRW